MNQGARGLKSVVAVAGEASGDMIGAAALAPLASRMALRGIGGPALKAVGMDCLASSDRLAVRGYVEALSRIPDIFRVHTQLLRNLHAAPPDLYLGLDAPDFNLRVARRMRGLGVRTAHLVCPTIWAWRPERRDGIAAAVEHLFCLFPFEPALFNGTQTCAHFVGHPMADLVPTHIDRAAAKAALGLKADSPVLAVLPGSRAGEISRLGPPFLQAAMGYMARGWQVVLPVASDAGRQLLLQGPSTARLAAQAVDRGLLLPDWRPGLSLEVMSAADLGLVASGTATLEAAMHRLPMVIGYKVPRLTAMLMQRKAIVKKVGLPNLLTGQDLADELLQEDCNAEALQDALERLWQSEARRSQVVESFAALHESLRQDCAGRVTSHLEEILDVRRGH